MTRQDEFDSIAKALRSEAEQHPVPDNLQPDAIEALLKTQDAKKNASLNNETTVAHQSMHKAAPRRRFVRYWPIAAAACLALLCGVGLATTLNDQNPPAPLPQDATSANSQQSAMNANNPQQKQTNPGNALATAESYTQVLSYLRAYEEHFSNNIKNEKLAAGDVMKQEAAAFVDTSSSITGGFSDTNVRTEGVGEADVVKTDGNYLYALQDDGTTIAIVNPADGHMTQAGSIKAVPGAQINEFYVENNRTFVLSTVFPEGVEQPDGSYTFPPETTRLDTFNVSDPTNPTIVGTVTQTGHYQTSRFTDGYVYVFSNQWNFDTAKQDDPAAYTPSFNGSVVACGDIYLPPAKMGDHYLVIAAVDANNPNETVSQKAVLCDEGNVYVSKDSIFLYETTGTEWGIMPIARFIEDPAEVDQAADAEYEDNGDEGSLDETSTDIAQTCIRKIGFNKGQLEGVAQAKVDGIVDDSFCLDEYNGNLRMVTTIYQENGDTENALYILNGQLEEVGLIANIAPGEKVYSARFMGDTGYFVTFKQVDPLFSVDLSNPENPTIIGQLKIPGFSEYLHPYSSNLLLGIGMSADEAGATDGLKLSMFDTTNPADVQEVATAVLDDTYYSDVFYDYRAALIEPERDMIGFPVSADCEAYAVYGYSDEEGFTQHMLEDTNGTGWVSTRGVRIGDVLYVVKGNALESYSTADYTKIDDLLL